MITSEIRIVARRDSATTILRKLGVNSRDYGLFISAKGKDAFEVYVDAAKKHVANVEAQANKPAKADEPTELAPLSSAIQQAAKKRLDVDKKPTKARQGSAAGAVSVYMKKLIKEGLTNKEIWEKAKVEFELDDTKRHYPAWYRSAMKRNGEM